MSAWTRVPPGAHVACGRCGDAIEPDAPVYRVTIPGVARPLARCEGCAGPAPPDLPARPVLAAPAPAQTLTRVAAPAAFDWRAPSAGREPGEDDA